MWTNVCIEGFCYSEKDENGKYPCGRSCTSSFCLLNRGCPYFMFSPTTERNVATFVPIKYILIDKIKISIETLRDWITWNFWYRFKTDKSDEFFDSIPVVSADEFPEILEEEAKLKKDFPKWIKKANKERKELCW